MITLSRAEKEGGETYIANQTPSPHRVANFLVRNFSGQVSAGPLGLSRESLSSSVYISIKKCPTSAVNCHLSSEKGEDDTDD